MSLPRSPVLHTTQNQKGDMMMIETFNVKVLKLDLAAGDEGDAILLSAPAERFPNHQPGDVLQAQVLTTGGGHDVLEVGSFGTAEEGIGLVEGIEELAGQVQIVVAAAEVSAYQFTPGDLLAGAYFGPTLSLIELPDATGAPEAPAIAVESADTGDEHKAIGADNPA